VAVKLLTRLRRAGFIADKDYLERGLRAQMKYADRWGATAAVIIGEEELNRGTVTVRHMRTGQQEEVSLARVEEVLAQYFSMKA
jgi:histidyl-tRNA synthetase